MATMLQLLQPVESSWIQLARYLLRDELQYIVQTIKSDCFQNDASRRALDDVFSVWLDRAIGPERTWQALCNIAKKYGDKSLEQYIQANNDIKGEL